MNRVVLAIFLSVLAFASCGGSSAKEARTPGAETAVLPKPPSSQEAIDYNEKVIGLQNRIVTKMLDFSKTFEGRDAQEMEAKLSELQETVDEAVLLVSALSPFYGDSTLRDGALELFLFYQSISKKEYREIVSILLGPQITQEDVDRIAAIDAEIGAKENVLDDAFQKTQQDFAKINGISLVDNALQKEIDSASQD